MAGPLTTDARVRELGGLNEATAYRYFWLADDPALTVRINREILIASAWLQSRAPDDYASGDAVDDVLFAEAEAYLALQSLYETLKMRKVLGTHYPVEAEGSERFEELIDVEMPEHIRKFIDGFLVIETASTPFAAPVLVTSGPVDRTLTQSVQGELDDLLNEANAAVPNEWWR